MTKSEINQIFLVNGDIGFWSLIKFQYNDLVLDDLNYIANNYYGFGFNYDSKVVAATELESYLRHNICMSKMHVRYDGKFREKLIPPLDGILSKDAAGLCYASDIAKEPVPALIVGFDERHKGHEYIVAPVIQIGDYSCYCRSADSLTPAKQYPVKPVLKVNDKDYRCDIADIGDNVLARKTGGIMADGTHYFIVAPVEKIGLWNCYLCPASLVRPVNYEWKEG